MGRGRSRPAPEVAGDDTDRLKAGKHGDLRDREARHPRWKAAVAGKNAKHLSRTIKQIPQARSQYVPLLTACLIPCCAPVSEGEVGDEQTSSGSWRSCWGAPSCSRTCRG